MTSRALAQIEVLNQQISALRRQLAALEEALEASEKRDKESQGRIADLGQRLNVALAQRVQELSRYRSEFFGRLRAILGNRPDIRIVGDRFVFQSEVFFDTGQALLLPEGRAELDKLATALIDLDKQIPSEIAWVLRVDGHTDVRPINSPAVQVELGIVVGARDLGGAVSGLSRRARAAAGRRRLCRIPAARHRSQRRSLQAQPPHRAEADGTVVVACISRSAPIAPRTKTPRSRCGVETWQQAYPSIDFTARVAWWRERWRNELVPNAAIIVAEQAGALIGFVTIDAIGLSRPARGQPRSLGLETRRRCWSMKRSACRPTASRCWSTRTTPAPSASTSAMASRMPGRMSNPTSGRPVLRMT